MPRSQVIPFGLMAYESRSLPWSAQRLVNWYPESAPGIAKTKTPFILLPRPGLELFATVLGDFRGQIVVTGVEYAVFGNTLYLITQAGTAIALGTIPGTQPITMAENGDQITIVAEPRAWVYTISTASFQQILDPDFPGSKWVGEVGGYFVHAKPGNSGEFFTSNLLDGLSFDALNFATAEMDSDALLAPVGDHGELWLFGTDTIEPWANVGGTDFPFAPIQSARIQRGCSAPYSITRQDNTLFWIGEDRVVYRAAGYVPNRVSTHAIEKLLTDAGDDISLVVGTSYTQDGHSFVLFTLPGSWTIAYDNATRLWSERETWDHPYWKILSTLQCYGKIIGGHEDGNLYELVIGKHTDDGTKIQFQAISPALHANTARLTMSRLQIDFQTGVGIATGLGSDPQAILDWTPDGGQTWSYQHWRGMGLVGEYNRRVIWRRLGQFYSRMFRITVTDPVVPHLLGAYADFDVTPT